MVIFHGKLLNNQMVYPLILHESSMNIHSEVGSSPIINHYIQRIING